MAPVDLERKEKRECQIASQCRSMKCGVAVKILNSHCKVTVREVPFVARKHKWNVTNHKKKKKSSLKLTAMKCTNNCLFPEMKLRNKTKTKLATKKPLPVIVKLGV